MKCIVEGCNEEYACVHCEKCQKHHDEELGLESSEKKGFQKEEKRT